MRSLVWYSSQLYEHVWSLRDRRLDSWTTITKGSFVFPLLIGYIYVAKVGGPRWMKGRNPYDLKRAILAYNVFVVLASAYFVCRMLPLTYFGGGYSFLCQGVGLSNSERDTAILHLNWWYFLVRIAEFLDTFFFVARKKFSHITQLHVVHHSLVVLSGWIWLHFASDGQGIFGLCVNAFVHTVMYSYYFLAALGPGLQKYLWWKKYLTTLQIVQLVIFSTHIALPLLFDCGYPKPLCYIGVALLILTIILFLNFYLKTYKPGGRSVPVLDKKSKTKGE
ncbi:hypothetical protein HPB48_008234 [Haemaphysalis longicornis]|uniref:Elongation of very long chain fatty acids protein n=1 Tax=Haemaphysalis longicornis TaxID=44386 RepID=A0A9J6H2T1_HAELO|nr:hypothetical protein HPB48_008234 [Haemaphysalis longicornis]